MTVPFPTPPTAPSLSDPTNFDTRMDAFLVWMESTVTTWNTTPPYTVGDSPDFAGLSVNSGDSDTVATFESTDQFATIKLIDGTSTATTGGIRLGVEGNALYVSTGGTQTSRFRIENNGNIGINVTSAAHQLDISGQSKFTSNNLSTLGLNRTGSFGGVMFFQNEGSNVGTITVNGSATSYNTSSDDRLKENITPIQGAADIVKMMRPVTCTFISDGTWYDCFIAHELQELHPQAVTGTKDAVDEDGNPDYQTVDYSKLTPILTAALQEALAKIEALEARLTAAGI